MKKPSPRIRILSIVASKREGATIPQILNTIDTTDEYPSSSALRTIVSNMKGEDLLTLTKGVECKSCETKVSRYSCSEKGRALLADFMSINSTVWDNSLSYTEWNM